MKTLFCRMAVLNKIGTHEIIISVSLVKYLRAKKCDFVLTEQTDHRPKTEERKSNKRSMPPACLLPTLNL